MNEITNSLNEMGIEIEYVHKEAGASQLEIIMKYGPILYTIDSLHLAKHAIASICRRKGL